MEICLQGRCGLSRFVESQKSLYSCIDWGMSTHIRGAYTFATVVLLLVNTTFCLESISECFVSSFFSFRTLALCASLRKLQCRSRLTFSVFSSWSWHSHSCSVWLADWVICQSLVLACLGLHEYSWDDGGPLEPGCCQGVAVTTDGTYCWQMTLWEREQESERGLQVSSDIYSISQSSSSKYWLVGTTKNTEILSCPHTEKTTMTGQW